MVFGFNSEVVREGTSYHVQSEVRTLERVLDTQVFVGGRCVGKRTSALAAEEGFPEERIREQLKEQHRQVLAAIGAGEWESLLTRPVLHGLGVRVRAREKVMVLHFRVDPVPARVQARLEADGCPAVSAEAAAASDGSVELEFPFASAATTATLWVETKVAGGSSKQKFRLHRK